MSEKTTELLDIFDGGTKQYSKEQPAPKKMRKQKSIYGDQLICLTALAGLSVWQSGLRALVICLSSVIVCMLSDMIFCKMTKKTYNPKDLSTIASGFCIALMMPSSVHYGIVCGAALLAIAVKHIFGGKDNYIFNPTCVAIAFMIICYPNDMLTYPAAGTQPEAFAEITAPLVPGIENYLIKLGTAPSVSIENIIIGNFAGPMGTTQFLVIAICGICLLCRRSMSLLVTLFGLGSYCALTALFPVFTDIGETLILEIAGGYLLFGFVFLAGDPQTMPKSTAGKICYGMVIGIVGCLFRHFGKVEGSFIFVLLIANVLSLRIDELCVSAAKSFKAAFNYFHKHTGSFEKLRDNAENEVTPKLTDTMEIIVPATNYNMPPIDNKVTKIRRKKTNIISRYAEKLRLKRKKDELIAKQKSAESDYMNAMRNMQKAEHRNAAKPEGQKTGVLHKIKQPPQKSQQKNNKQGNK